MAESFGIEIGYHCCPCCGRGHVKNEYDYCYGCMMKWKKVFESCVSGGYSNEMACRKADEAYPRRFPRGEIL
jgi:hypothetical protein